MPGTPDDQITAVIDTSAYMPERERAIAAHRSQVSPYDGLPDDLRRDFIAVEWLRRVVPAWEEDGLQETALFD